MRCFNSSCCAKEVLLATIKDSVETLSEIPGFFSTRLSPLIFSIGHSLHGNREWKCHRSDLVGAEWLEMAHHFSSDAGIWQEMETCSDKRKALAPILQRGQNYTNCFHVSIGQGHWITSNSSLVSINRSFICKSNIWITHISLNLSFISSRFFIEKKGDDAKKVIISRGHIKLKEWRGHGLVLPSEFVEGTEYKLILYLAAIFPAVFSFACLI